MKLEPFQTELADGLADQLTVVRKTVGQLSTGGGKTITFSGISNRYINASGKRVLILVHRIELLKSTRTSAWKAFRLDCQPIVAGMSYIPPADIYVGMVETVYGILKRQGKEAFGDVGLVIIDECHTANFNKVHKFFESEYIIGFTATPLSSNKKEPIKKYYESIVCGKGIDWLIQYNQKNPKFGLCQNITWSPKEVVDRGSLQVKGSEFDEGLMSVSFSKSKYIQSTINAYEKFSPATKAIIFNVNVTHSEAVRDAFLSRGYECKHIDGGTPKTERTKILAWYADTEGAILCNVGIATTGFDEPSIQTVIVNKATLSMPLWLQMCGRGSRPHPSKKGFTIIDMGGNGVTHGDWSAHRDWEDIFYNPPKPGEPSAAPQKVCPSCEGLVPSSTRICKLLNPETEKPCLYEWPVAAMNAEEELHDFVMITKNIDVAELVRLNSEKKAYYTMFLLGRKLVEAAKKKIDAHDMTDRYFDFILDKYHELVKKWSHEHKKRYTQELRNLAHDSLLEEVKKKFPNWNTDKKVLKPLQFA